MAQADVPSAYGCSRGTRSSFPCRQGPNVERAAISRRSSRHASVGPSSPNGRLMVAVAQIGRHPSERPHATPPGSPRSWPGCPAAPTRSSSRAPPTPASVDARQRRWSATQPAHDGSALNSARACDAARGQQQERLDSVERNPIAESLDVQAVAEYPALDLCGIGGVVLVEEMTVVEGAGRSGGFSL